jgi:hypothetical protein
MVAHPDSDELAAAAESERVTHTLGVTIDGVPRLGA